MKTKPILQKALILLCFLVSGAGVYGQAGMVTGVVSSEDGEPLIGANVLVKGTSRGTVTDLDGKFSVEVSAGDILLVSFTGFENLELEASPGQDLQITLRQGTLLNEVVVTALGISREKKALGYAVQEVGSTQILEAKQNNVVNALQGQVAGVLINSSGGGPGESARIIIRGVNSLDPSANNEPLFVIDGIPVSNSTFTIGGGSARNISNRLADINPDDIENISVLKGGAATALYGLRAANGAVIITTKKGKSGKIRVEVSSTYGTEEVNKFPETQRLYTQGYADVYDPNSFWPTWGPTIEEARALDPNHPETIFNNYENAYQTGNQWRNSINLTGGTDVASFRASISNLQHEGVLPFSEYENTSFRFNGDYNPSSWLSMGGSINYIKSGGPRVLAESFNERLVYWAPQADVTDYKFENGSMRGYRNGGTIGNNPIYSAATNRFVDDVDRFIGNMRFTAKISDALSVNYVIGLDQYSDFRSATAPAPFGFAGENVLEENGLGFVRETRIRNRDITSNISATFRKEITSGLNLNVLAGYDIFNSSLDRVFTSGDELDIYNLFSLNNAAIIRTSSYKQDYRLMGLYGDISVDYKNTLYLSITGRNDWSSALPVETRSFFYPSVSVGYVFSENIELPEFITFGKLRASYAGIGKDTDPYRINTVYQSASGFPIEGITGWTRGNVKGAADLKPERTETLEFGLDLRLLKNRIGIDFTYYDALSTDQIIPVPVSPTTGFTSFILNAGSIRNKGVELVLTASPVQSQNFNWDVNLNFSRNRNNVEKIRDGIEEIVLGSHFGYVGSSASLRLIEGQPYGNIFGRSLKRYYANPEDEGIVLDKDLPLLIDARGYPILETSQKVLGNATPDWFGAITNTFTYKGFSLSFMFDTRQGVQKYNQMDNFFAAFGIAPYTVNRNSSIVFEGVRADGTPNTTPAWLGQATGPNGERALSGGYYRAVYRTATENFIEDADWIRLRNLSFTYRFPRSVMDRLPLEDLSLSFTGQNLWLDTPYSGFDPEGNRGNGNADDGFGGFTYPGVRRLMFTVNARF
ncbi:MAG: SusC/RagA family TonB-linked outer membrane protein [Saprospiraceae bacterium]|nr:SusC/RagA family TonB-linked outer membrane protein [Saprospiraceae bacterium]